MVDNNSIPEEKLSALMDKELSASEIKVLQEAIVASPDLEKIKDDLQLGQEAFTIYRSQPAEEVPFERFYEGITTKLRQESANESVLAGDPVDTASLLKLLVETRRPSLWERIFSGLVPAMVGAAAALVVVFIVSSRTAPKTGAPGKQPVTVSSNTSTLPSRVNTTAVPPKRTLNVSTNPEVKPGSVLPNSDVANIVNQADSCIIESMNAEDETVTTVFKVADQDGSMITVIWLPVEDEGTSI